MNKQLEVLPPKLFGITLDNVDDDQHGGVARIIKKIDAIKKDRAGIKPIVRVVFDFDSGTVRQNKYGFSKEDFVAEAEDYRPALERISQHAYIMGEIVDSSEVYLCHYDPIPTKVYVERIQAYAETLGGLVNIWEIGNEINGEWVGWKESAWRDPNVTIQDMTAVRQRVKTELAEALAALGPLKGEAKTAITFYFNEDGDGAYSWSDDLKLNRDNGKLEKFGQEYSMLKWAEDCKTALAGVDYIFISYYQDDNYFGVGTKRKPIIPSFATWAKIFQKLHVQYPHAHFGFGEVSPQCYYKVDDASCKLQEANDDWDSLDDDKKCDRACSCCVEAQEDYITRYYDDWDRGIRTALKSLQLEDLYVGGYFYWYFKEDAVNKQNPDTVGALQKAFDKWFP